MNFLVIVVFSHLVVFKVWFQGWTLMEWCGIVMFLVGSWCFGWKSVDNNVVNKYKIEGNDVGVVTLDGRHLYFGYGFGFGILMLEKYYLSVKMKWGVGLKLKVCMCVSVCVTESVWVKFISLKCWKNLVGE